MRSCKKKKTRENSFDEGEPGAAMELGSKFELKPTSSHAIII
jgi:hypothetical protein